VTISTCHSACTTCTGPKSTDCSSCATANMVSVNGTCVCDSANGWYWQSTACVKPCQTSPQLYGDPLTYTCVQPTSCSFPNTFGSPSGLCVQYCPNVSGTAYYAYAGTMVCVTDCYTTYGQYKFNGANNSCYAVCPNNYVAALTGECLTKCPTSSYRLIENNATNPKCSLTCTTGYKFDGDNTCVSICPVGYFISSGACVKTCPAGKYGDVVNNSGTLNGSCVTNCSNNYYAD
jgi:proprotein convertase subtilisin/kexin type 5